MHSLIFLLCVMIFLRSHAKGQGGVKSPLSFACGPEGVSVQCINHYAAVLPLPFYRPAVSGSISGGDALDWSFTSTLLPNSTGLRDVAQANFILFDWAQGSTILGANASYDVVLQTNDTRTYDAPVWVPAQNKLYFAVRGPPGYLPQMCIDLTKLPPTLTMWSSNPTMYVPGDMALYHGKILVAAAGSNVTYWKNNSPMSYRPGLVVVDPDTREQDWLLNNYFGYFFNGLSGVAVDKYGGIWFTDSDYSWFDGYADTPPQSATGVYRFEPSTGAVTIVEDSLWQPKGIAFSPSGDTLYLSDSSARRGSITGPKSTGLNYNTTTTHTVYAYEVYHSPGYIYLRNKRPVYRTMDWTPDAIKTSAEGYILVAAGKGIDVLNPWGTLIMRVQTNFIVKNFVWTGSHLTTLWIFGVGSIAIVKWELQGTTSGLLSVPGGLSQVRSNATGA